MALVMLDCCELCVCVCVCVRVPAVRSIWRTHCLEVWRVHVWRLDVVYAWLRGAQRRGTVFRTHLSQMWTQTGMVASMQSSSDSFLLSLMVCNVVVPWFCCMSAMLSDIHVHECSACVLLFVAYSGGQVSSFVFVGFALPMCQDVSPGLRLQRHGCVWMMFARAFSSRRWL